MFKRVKYSFYERRKPTMIKRYGPIKVITREEGEAKLYARIYDGGQDVTAYFDGVLGRYNKRDGLVITGKNEVDRFYRDTRPAIRKVIGAAVA
jgi:hypothetical protein